MTTRDDILLIVRLLREGLDHLDNESAEWNVDEFHDRPRLDLKAGFDALQRALDRLKQLGRTLSREVNSAINGVLAKPPVPGQERAVEQAADRILSAARAVHRFEFQTRRLAPPRVLDDCFKKFRGVSARCHARLRKLANDLEQMANESWRSETIEYEFVMSFEPHMEQLIAEIERVREITEEVFRFVHDNTSGSAMPAQDGRQKPEGG